VQAVAGTPTSPARGAPPASASFAADARPATEFTWPKAAPGWAPPALGAAALAALGARSAPDLRVVEFRGNVANPSEKVADGVANATFLAVAALKPAGHAAVPATTDHDTLMLPAVGHKGDWQSNAAPVISTPKHARRDPRHPHRDNARGGKRSLSC